ncbi:MAG: polysaccharide biosynthesis protein [Gammaproteobacteria bacterium]
MLRQSRPRFWERKRQLIRLFVFLHDSLWIILSVVLALALRVEGSRLAALLGNVHVVIYVGLAYFCQSASLYVFGCYRGIWRFASLPDLIRLTEAVGMGLLLTLGTATFLDPLATLPHGLLILQPLLLLAGLGSGRLAYRIWKERWALIYRSSGRHAVVVGAGFAAELLLRDLWDDRTYVPVAFVDDDPAKQGRTIHRVPVAGRLSDLERVIEESRAQVVIYAIPSAPRSVLHQIVQTCQKMRIPCQTLPRLSELVNQRITIDRLRPVSVEDVLGREPVMIATFHLQEFFHGKRVLVTGAGGSIGSEISRQLLALGVARLILLDHAEYNLYRILTELEGHAASRVEGHLLDACSRTGMDRLFASSRPEIVFHAAAYKHVTLVENNPISGVLNNVLGTQVVAETAIRHQVERFVFVSTDKAVWPTNIMGATKRVAERIALHLNGMGGTGFVTVRFGNVLDSVGSVVPRFRAQIQAGGPVTVTHPEVKRYFMTIQEAVHLVLEAGASRPGGGTFVLDMGEPILIRDLAAQMIELSGYRLGEDMEIVYIGLRQGEKLSEQLFYENERRVATEHPKLFLAQNDIPTDWPAFKHELERCFERIQTSSRDELVGELVRLTHGDFRLPGEPPARTPLRSTVIPLAAARSLIAKDP